MVSVTKPHTRKMTIIAQDPDLQVGKKILTTEVEIPAEELSHGPRGYRVHVVDYDTTTGTLTSPVASWAVQSVSRTSPGRKRPSSST